MNGVIDNLESDDSEFVEVDPTGRYGRYNEILGKGASKTVYRAFDEYEGIEVAWNQVKLYDFLQSPEDLERLYCEIHLLKTLKHSNIMKFYTSWVDTSNRNINFVTEMFTSGTLRQYRQKHKRVNIRAVKHWCRQILQGLLYLHSHDPPVIHRDLKCDNIFINGNQGEVKIGDLGLAAILRKSHAAHCVGTPEFMAPEVYEEEYNELVDIYSFGMCLLEMVTFEYPYSECNHPAQIYKKVITGKRPDSLYKVKDPEVRRFVDKCLATVSQRLSARELLNDPFLQFDDYVGVLRPIDYFYCYYKDYDETSQPVSSFHHSVNGSYPSLCYEHEIDLDCQSVDYEANGLEFFTSQEDDHLENDVDITIKGRRREDDNVFLRLRIADKEGRVRNIYFPFDTETDTALSVATEMVAELDITDQDVTKIAEMIDDEISSLVPEWKRGFTIQEEESPNNSCCQNCALDGSLVDYLSAKNLQVIQCSKQECGGAMHGRFEEITYQLDGSSEQCLTSSAPVASSQSEGIHYTDIWAQHDVPESSLQDNQLDSEFENSDQSSSNVNDEKQIVRVIKENKSTMKSSSPAAKDYENEIRQEMRWLKAKYQMQLRELRDQQLGITSNIDSDIKKKLENDKLSNMPQEEKDEGGLNIFSSPTKHLSKFAPLNADKSFNNNSQEVHDYESAYNSCSPVHMTTAKSFYTGALLPPSLHRATSLPVDATDC